MMIVLRTIRFYMCSNVTLNSTTDNPSSKKVIDFGEKNAYLIFYQNKLFNNFLSGENAAFMYFFFEFVLKNANSALKLVETLSI